MRTEEAKRSMKRENEKKADYTTLHYTNYKHNYIFTTLHNTTATTYYNYNHNYTETTLTTPNCTNYIKTYTTTATPLYYIQLHCTTLHPALLGEVTTATIAIIQKKHNSNHLSVH